MSDLDFNQESSFEEPEYVHPVNIRRGSKGNRVEQAKRYCLKNKARRREYFRKYRAYQRGLNRESFPPSE